MHEDILKERIQKEIEPYKKSIEEYNKIEEEVKTKRKNLIKHLEELFENTDSEECVVDVGYDSDCELIDIKCSHVSHELLKLLFELGFEVELYHYEDGYLDHKIDCYVQ